MNESIFIPHYTNSSAISTTLETIERHRWLIDNMLMMPKHEVWLQRQMRVTNVKRASGTTRIEGAALDEEAVGRLVNRGTAANYTRDEQANINALQAYEFIDFLSDQPDIPIDELVIRQLNRYFLAGTAGLLTPGVYRRGQNKIGEYTPPDQGDVPDLMRSFALWLRTYQNGVHPVLKAGLAHIHTVAIHPFWDGNGRTARGLSTLVLQRSPFGFRKLLSLEAHLFSVRQDYIAAIEHTLGTSFNTSYDATSWLEFFVVALARHLQELVDKLANWYHMMGQAQSFWASKGLPERQGDAYAFAVQAGQISRSDYIEVTGVSPVTASRDLAEMVKAGVMIPEGKTRRRIYRPVPLGSEPKAEVPQQQLSLLPGE